MTIKELAEELKMSTTTVSRVLTGQEEKYRISSGTAQKVRELAEAHQFAPNQIARNLRLQKTNTIGLIIPDISNPFFANLARAVELELRKYHKMILLCDTKDETTLEQESLSLLLGRKVDGLLIAPVGKTAEHISKIKDIPLVLIDRYFDGDSLPYVTTDNFQGAFDATKFLIAKGHKNIACIQGLIGTSANASRVLGYRKAMLDHDIPEFYVSVSGDDYSIETGYRSTKALLAQAQPPTAIFALNNQIAMGAMKAIKEEGLKIPENISLLAFDEQPYFELLSPPLTAIKQPMQEIGKVAVDMLLELLEGKKVGSRMLQPHFIERKSVAGPL
ncbi:MAG: LacI family DNA-binding transcriptional regulator [Bacteroidota bacterium]